jgi:sugar phosphate isomerase/epimerase
MEPAVPRISCSTLAFREQTLDIGLARIADLGFSSVDLAVFAGYTPDLTLSDLAADPRRFERRVMGLLDRNGLEAVALNADPPLGDAAEAADLTVLLLTLAERIGARVITLGPPERGVPLDQAATMLSPLVAATRGTSVQLTVETHVFGVTEMPEDAARLVEAVPGLGLTLDPGHYSAGPGRGRSLDTLYPHVRHLHVRDAGVVWEEIQVEFGSGVVDFSAVFTALDAQGYRGPCSIEYIGDGRADGIEESVSVAANYVRSHWQRYREQHSQELDEGPSAARHA